jgi:hypothetical protein
MPWLLEPMAELSELRFGAAVTSEAETEPYESVPLNVESTYVVCIEGGAAAQGFASGMQWIFFPGTRLSDHSVPSAAAADGPVDNESLELEGLGGDPSFCFLLLGVASCRCPVLSEPDDASRGGAGGPSLSNKQQVQAHRHGAAHGHRILCSGREGDMAARSSSAWISGERAVTGFFSLLGLPPRRRGDMVHNAKMIDSQQQKTSSFSIDQRGVFLSKT